MSWNKYGSPESINFIFEQSIYLHDFIILLGGTVLFILLFNLTWGGIFLTPLSTWPLKLDRLELFWTIIPLLLIVSIIIPSVRVLSFLEEPVEQLLNLKITANQWYWIYQYLNNIDYEIESSILEGASDFKPFNLLEVDNRIIIPFHTNIALLVTRRDVIHSWALPSIGVKIDALPGRLNRLFIYAEKPGIFWGQCREICGVNHRFIPITVEFVNIKSLIKTFNI